MRIMGFFSSLFSSALSDSVKRNIFKPDIHVVGSSIRQQTDWLKVIRLQLVNSGTSNAEDVEASLTSIVDPEGKEREVIEAPLWWMHNQYKPGDRRTKDVPMTQKVELDVCNLIQRERQVLLRLSSEAFLGDRSDYTILKKGLTKLVVIFRERNGHQQQVLICIDWDGSFSDPKVTWE